MPMEFEWDANKATSNLKKHGIRFEEAVLVFDDPQHLSRHDRYENGEYRWQTIGLVHGVIVVLVAHSVRFESGTEVIRIISARKADGKELSVKTSSERWRTKRMAKLITAISPLQVMNSGRTRCAVNSTDR